MFRAQDENFLQVALTSYCYVLSHVPSICVPYLPHYKAHHIQINNIVIQKIFFLRSM